MKIALISDIHANLPALEAVLADIDARNPDALYCLGDLVGYNIWPNEVIAAIRKRRIPTIAGNYDFGIGLQSDDCGCAYKTEEEKAMGKVSISLTNELVHPDHRAYLRALPAHLRIEYRFGAQQQDLLLVHGSPRRVNEYLFEDRDEKSMQRIMTDAGASILCFGHTHRPYHRILEQREEGGERRYLHAINTGSVGKPKDGDPRACYVLLTLDERLSAGDKDSVRVEFVRIPYDVERAALGVEGSILPDAYAQMLRKGG